MMVSSAHEVTGLLQAWCAGEQAALEKLVPLVHAELHRLAHRHLARERPGHTLQTTALVNEAYLRLIDWKNVEWQNRAHFFGVAAQLMRHILVDFARRRAPAKRTLEHLSFDEALEVSSKRSADLVALDDALSALARIDERKSRIVELRFFGGLSEAEIAEVLRVSTKTVQREWFKVRAWLYCELRGENTDEA
jgi:RNA polymerase sigma factor (TIGR02999 family)